MLLRGARRMLELLAGRGLELFLASGTDEHYVREEAALLKVDGFFNGGMYGAHGASLADSKDAVIRRLLGERKLAGAELLCFGDGFVEIDAVKAVGGYAVGVASDESAGGGKVNAWKRDRLVRAGADMIVPDFDQAERIVKLLLGE
jgi:phosphoglycolate phosphatase-like HAD superfamily hydrolase